MREKCPRCNQPIECMGPNIVGDLTRKILSDKRRNSVSSYAKIASPRGHRTREFSKSGDHYNIYGNKMDFSLNMSVKDRDLQG
jgi:hypothetical protein